MLSQIRLKIIHKTRRVYIDSIQNSSIETSSKGGNYQLFKGELKFENYLDILEDKDKGVGMIRAEIGLKNRQIINETYSFRCFLIL